LAITKHGEVNAVVAQRALEEFAPPRVIAVLPQEQEGEEGAETANLKQARLAKLPLKKWNTYLQDGEVRLGETWLRDSDTDLQQAHLSALMRSGEMVPLLLERDGILQVAIGQEGWRVGDRLIYLLHDAKPKLLKRLAGGIQPPALTLETLPTVEEVPLAIALSLDNTSPTPDAG
jgi:Trk K+ transport system NAD-binding subunit